MPFIKPLKKLLCVLALGTSIGYTSPAFATEDIGEGYSVPTFREIVQTFTLMGGLDSGNEGVIDEYMNIVYCNIFLKSYSNDFEWNKIRRNMQLRIQEKKENYRLLYEIIGPVTIGRYDFEEQSFPLVGGTALENVGVLSVYRFTPATPICGGGGTQELKYYPFEFFIELNRPLNINNIKVSMDEAEVLLKKIIEYNGDPVDKQAAVPTNIKRQIYIRFRVRVSEALGVTGRDVGRKAVMRAQLQSIDFFIDREATMHITSIPIITR